MSPLPSTLALTSWAVATAAALLTLALVALAADRLRNPRRRSGLALWWRLRWRLYPGRGFARRLELHLHYGLPAARKVARRARPCLRGWWSRHVVRRNEIALFLGWAQGWLIRFRAYATLEDHILCLAPHKEGKTAHLAGWIIDAPGAAIVTSIRDDVVDLTAGLRGNVELFNPERFGTWASTVRWSPVHGCHDPATALRRAATMVAATETGGLSDQTFWTNQAAMTLAALLYAAGLEDLSLEHVDAWTLNEDPTPLKILTRPRPGHNTSRAAALVRRYHNLHVRTRDSIYLTLRQVLRCMDDPDIAHLLCPPVGEGLDLEAFLRQRGTLYLISGDSTHPATPLLFATLISEIHHQARMLASPRPNRRMDPPVTFVLDEAPEICPIPQLPGWIATAAGSGFVFIIAGQSWSQFQHRWSEHGATTIWNNCKAKMLFGATSDPHDLKVMSDLAGEITLPYREKTVDSSGKPYYTRRWETVPVLPPDHARRLPTWRALVVRRNATPTIVRTEQVWKRADYKRWKTKDGTIPFLPLTPTPPAPTPATTPPSTDDSATPPPTRQPRSSRPWHIKRP
ncbi:type IV secretory system conjugative DNA transfer family protein [[Actinomadura] parvosata]|uniref:type IV secretory system conjugative DNA transfer family protein n=1 Tax=[Actinomadura] parvosata TaxID=1955412 RepID=UPI00406C7425